MKEKIIKAAFNQKPLVNVRVIEAEDSDKVKADKKKYPFELENGIIITIETTERKFSFQISRKYIWNGADIPRFLWKYIGSRTDNAFLIASMVHDFMLEFKKYMLDEILENQISMKEYRRLTSLIFRQLLKDANTWVIKANLMSWCVDVFQSTANRKAWNITEAK